MNTHADPTDPTLRGASICGGCGNLRWDVLPVTIGERVVPRCEACRAAPVGTVESPPPRQTDEQALAALGQVFGVVAECIPDTEVNRALAAMVVEEGRCPPPYAVDMLRRLHADSTARQQNISCRLVRASATQARTACPPSSDVEHRCDFRASSICPRRDEIQHEERRRERDANLARAGAPAQIRADVMAGVPRSQAAQIVRDVLRLRTPRLVVLAGIQGCGKDTAIGIAVAERGGVWLDAATLGRAQNTERVEEWVQAPVLALSNFGTMHSPSGYGHGIAAEVLRRRCDGARPTFCSTNLTKRQWWHWWPEQLRGEIASRMRGFGAFRWVTDGDFRSLPRPVPATPPPAEDPTSFDFGHNVPGFQGEEVP